MARMIPVFCLDDAPPGEKAVYSAIRDSDGTEGWLVFHSVGIANHVRQVAGEADFVVVAPDHGILVIEVKSHHIIDRRSDGTWKLGSNAPTARGPFQQANEAMYSLRSYLLKNKVDLRSVPVISAVWFTGVRARSILPASPEWHEWQVLDSDDLKSPVEAIVRTFNAGAAHLEHKIKYFSYGGVGPSKEKAKSIANALRPKFEVIQTPSDRQLNRDTQLTTLIEEQFLALDAASDNRTVLFTGPAGSGKTFLAMEAARREIATRKQGRFLCYNRLLARRLTSAMKGLDRLSVSTLHQEMLRIAELDQIPKGAGHEFWSDELPERALNTLDKRARQPLSDFLIIDEIQDLSTDLYLQVLDRMVDGGLQEGRLLLFGDFEKQAIFTNPYAIDLLRMRIPHLPTYRLMQNCRNLPRIGYQVNLLSRLQPGYKRFRRMDDGIDPLILSYQHRQNQSALLSKAIRSLKEDGYQLSEIVVLSPLKSASTAATTTDAWLRKILKPGDGLEGRPGHVLYYTIHSFKGLEAPAVILTDLDSTVTGDTLSSLVYIGLTRATDRLVALFEANALHQILGGTT